AGLSAYSRTRPDVTSQSRTTRPDNGDMAQTPPTFLTVPEAAAEFGVSPRTVFNWIRDGQLPALQPGGPGHSVRIDRHDLPHSEWFLPALRDDPPTARALRRLLTIALRDETRALEGHGGRLGATRVTARLPVVTTSTWRLP